jgi:predicted ABC-type exoprotein transport system permease subunit
MGIIGIITIIISTFIMHHVTLFWLGTEESLYFIIKNEPFSFFLSKFSVNFFVIIFFYPLTLFEKNKVMNRVIIFLIMLFCSSIVILSFMYWGFHNLRHSP